MVSQAVRFDPKYGQNVVTETWKSFEGAHVPSQSSYFDYHAEEIAGEFTTSFRYTVSGTGAYSYKVHGAIQTAPLITNPMFSSTTLGATRSGAYPLTANDLNKIKSAEANPSMWEGLSKGGTDISDGLKLYAELILQGVTMYEEPTVMLSITVEEDTPADLTSLAKICTVTNAPAVPEGTTWLLTGADSEAQFSSDGTTYWLNSYHFKASGKSGWNTKLYDAGSWSAGGL